MFDKSISSWNLFLPSRVKNPHIADGAGSMAGFRVVPPVICIPDRQYRGG
jgi:hypothetical protein